MPKPAPRRRRRLQPEELPEAFDVFMVSLGALTTRLMQSGQWPEVQRVMRLMTLSADGASADVQYAAVLQLALTIVNEMIQVPIPHRPGCPCGNEEGDV